MESSTPVSRRRLGPHSHTGASSKVSLMASPSCLKLLGQDVHGFLEIHAHNGL